MQETDFHQSSYSVCWPAWVCTLTVSVYYRQIGFPFELANRDSCRVYRIMYAQHLTMAPLLPMSQMPPDLCAASEPLVCAPISSVHISRTRKLHCTLQKVCSLMQHQFAMMPNQRPCIARPVASPGQNAQTKQIPKFVSRQALPSAIRLLSHVRVI